MSIKKTFYHGVIGFVLLIAIWQVIFYLRIFQAILIPSPLSVLQTLFLMFYTGAIYPNLFATLYRTIGSFLISMVIGIPMGLLLGQYKLAYRLLQPMVEFFRAVPATALFPLFILFLGLNDLSIFGAVIFGTVFIIILNSMYGVHNANKSRMLLAKSMQATQFQIFSKVTFYDALPYIFVGVRQALSLSLIIVIVTEMFFGSATGLGYLIYHFQLLYQTAAMYAVIILVGMIGYLINLVFLHVERRMVHWSGK